MTIIALYQRAEAFECYADSLVSIGSTSGIRRYCKVLVVPVAWTHSADSGAVTGRHSFGMAIAGNLAAATSVYTVASNVLQNLYTFNKDETPSINHIADFLVRLANEVFEEVRVLGNAGLFGFFLFGFDARNKTPFAMEISAKQDPTGIFHMVRNDLAMRPEGLDFLGSGAGDFQQYLLSNAKKHAGLGFEDRFYKYVTSGITSSVGGLPQLLIATPHSVRVDPVLIGQDDGMHAAVTHSGMKVDGHNAVGPFGVGFQMKGFNMEECERVQALKNAELPTDYSNLSVGLVNQALLQWRIGISARNGSVTNVAGTIEVETNPHLSGGSYFSYPCPECSGLVPLFKAVGPEGYQAFRNDVIFQITCNSCKKKFQIAGNSYHILTRE